MILELCALQVCHHLHACTFTHKQYNECKIETPLVIVLISLPNEHSTLSAAVSMHMWLCIFHSALKICLLVLYGNCAHLAQHEAYHTIYYQGFLIKEKKSIVK